MPFGFLGKHSDGNPDGVGCGHSTFTRPPPYGLGLCLRCLQVHHLALLRVRDVWDAPLIAANHLLMAASENEGAYHFSADLVLGAAP